MKEDPFVGVYRALSPKELAEMFMNPNAPKTEAEHWAVREIEKLRAEVERLRASLKPFAQLYLWPDDLGEDMATLLRAEADWCEATNEDADSDVFIKRKYIRAARAALEAKP